MAHIMSALSLATVIVTGISVQDLVPLAPSTIRPGQALFVELTGKRLKDYAHCCNISDDIDNTSFCVFVHQLLGDE